MYQSKNFYQFSVSLLIFIFIFILFNCTSKYSTKNKEILTIATNYSVADIKPNQTGSGMSAHILELLNYPLISLGPKMEIIPILAKSVNWQNNGTRVNIKLKGVNPEDVKFTFEKIKNEGGSWLLVALENLDRIEIVSKNEIIFYLKKYDRLFLIALQAIQIISKEDENKGTGDFKIAEVKADQVTLIRKVPIPNKVNQIKFIVIPSQRRALREIAAGNVDLLYYSNLGQYDVIEDLPNMKVFEAYKIYLFCLFENHYKRAPKELINWSQINKQLKQDQIVEILGEVSYEIAQSTIYPNTEWYEAENRIELSVTKKAIIDDKKREIMFLEGQNNEERLALLMKRLLVGEGIQADLFRASPDEFFQKVIEKKDFDLLLLPVVYNDPFSFHYFGFRSIQNAKDLNPWNYHNESVDGLLDEARYSYDFAKAKSALNEAAKEIMKDPPGLFISWIKYPIIYRDTCKGYRFDSSFFVSLKDVQCVQPAQ